MVLRVKKQKINKRLAVLLLSRFFSGAIDSCAWYALPVLFLFSSGLPDNSYGADFRTFGKYVIASWFIYIALTIVGIVWKGNTPAQFLFQIKVTNSLGKKPGFFKGFLLRIFFPYIIVIYTVLELDALVFAAIVILNILPFFWEGNRFLHDYLSGTFVVIDYN